MTMRFLAVSICAAGLAFAQTATPPAPTTGTNPTQGPRGRGPGRGPGRGSGGGFRGLDVLGPRAEERLTKQLSLNATQQNTLHTAILSAQVQRKGLNEQSRSLQAQLATAVKGGNESAIDSITRELSSLHQQETSVHAKTLATLYGSLSAEQKVKIEPALNRELGVPGPRPAGRGPGGRGPRQSTPVPPAAQQ